MKTQHVIATLCALSLAILFAGCGPDTAAIQLKQAQDDLAKVEARAVAAEKERNSLRGDAARCALEREQARNDVQFFAKKVNPLEHANFEKEQLIEKLKKELEECRKAASQVEADANAASAATQEPAAAEPKLQ